MDIILNWLVQGVIVAIVAGAALRIIPLTRAKTRYGFVWLAYLLVMALPAVPAGIRAAADMLPVDLAPVSATGVVTVPTGWWTSSAVVIALWVSWCGVHAVHLAVGVRALRHARRDGVECPSEVLTRLPHWLRVHTTGRPARVVFSNRVHAAAVLGGGSPMIALAPGIVDQISAADLDRVLVHEWAHVQRRDDIAQFAQQIVRMIVGWHPAGWWLDRQLAFEREVACDEIAVRVTGSAKRYAACLTTLAALPQSPLRSLPVLAAIAPSRLHRRIVRILEMPGAVARRGSLLAICGGLALVASAFAVGNMRIVVAAVASAIIPSSVAPRSAAVVITDAPTVRSAAPMAFVSSSGPGRRAANGTTRRVTRANDVSIDAANADATAEPPTELIASTPLPSSNPPLDARTSLSPAALSPVPSVDARDERAAENNPLSWTQATDKGIAIGRASQGAGLATAGFFSRFGKNIASTF